MTKHVEHVGDYDPWAWLYDRTLGPKYARHKLPFLERELFPHLCEGAKVLDLCCGTGQLAAALADRGYTLIGLDGSRDMLRFARQNAPGARFIEGDARDFDIARDFDAVVCASASLNHMESLDDLERVFRRVSAGLKEGGLFVFDINHPAQMARHWRGQPAEGLVCDDHACLITPAYDRQAAYGTFTVDIYRRPEGARTGLFRGLVARAASWRRIYPVRLKLLARFARFQPGWAHCSIAYPVWGHDLEAVAARLRDSGLAPAILTFDGAPLDEHHSAFFVCRKEPVEAAARGPELEELSQ